MHSQNGSNQNWQGQPQAQGYAQPQVVYVERKKKGGCMKWGAIILGIVLALVIVGSLIGGGDDSKDSTDDGKGVKSEKSASNKNKPLNLGETFTNKKGLEVVVESLGSESNVVGNQLTCAMVKYVNNGDKELNFTGHWDWKLQNPDGVITEPSILGDDTLDGGKLTPRGKIAGKVCFDGVTTGEHFVKFEPTLSLSAEKASWKAVI